MPDLQLSIPALPVLVPLWTGGVAVALAAVHRRGRLTPARTVTVVAACTYLAAVLALTLFPFQVALGDDANQAAWYDKVNLVPLLTIDPSGFVLNVVMTVPLGVLAPLLWSVPRVRTAAGIGLAFSLAIELTQAVSNVLLSSGRTGDVNDLIANTAGTVLGWYLLRRFSRSGWVSTVVDRASLVTPAGGLTSSRP